VNRHTLRRTPPLRAALDRAAGRVSRGGDTSGVRPIRLVCWCALRTAGPLGVPPRARRRAHPGSIESRGSRSGPGRGEGSRGIQHSTNSNVTPRHDDPDLPTAAHTKHTAARAQSHMRAQPIAYFDLLLVSRWSIGVQHPTPSSSWPCRMCTSTQKLRPLAASSARSRAALSCGVSPIGTTTPTVASVAGSSAAGAGAAGGGTFE
jgi:hypothetical protein